MIEYMVGTMRDRGKSRRYLRIKSDEEIRVLGDVVSFTKAQVDKVSAYECIIRERLKEEQAGGYFYQWYAVESVLVETDHTPQLNEKLEATISSADDTAIELYEANLAQQEVSAAQDDALIELYELIGGNA